MELQLHDLAIFTMGLLVLAPTLLATLRSTGAGFPPGVIAIPINCRCLMNSSLARDLVKSSTSISFVLTYSIVT